jgi:hypothetical protein
MYFNHRESDQEKLNNLITLAMNMSEEIKNTRVVRKERDVMEGRGLNMGGLLGLGGRGMGLDIGRRFS